MASSHQVPNLGFTPEAGQTPGIWHRTIPGEPLRNVVWMHVPKTGSTFEHIIFRAACRVEIGSGFIEPSQVRDIIQLRMCPNGTFAMFNNGHSPLAEKIINGNDSILKFTLLRTPARRIVSGFFHYMHDCRWLQAAHNISEHGSPLPTDERARRFYAIANVTHLQQYARCVAGCAARMLTGHRCGDAEHRPDVARALQVLRSFSFVGITDAWNVTVDAFSRRFRIPVMAAYDLPLHRKGARTPAWAENAIGTFGPLGDDNVFSEGVRMLASSVPAGSVQYGTLMRLIKNHTTATGSRGRKRS